MIRRSRLLVVAATVGAAVAVFATGSAASTDDVESHDGHTVLREHLSGFNEDAPGPGVISTPAAGTFRAVINEQGQEISYTLSYSEITGALTQAHIHLGGPRSGGGIIVFLCSNLGNGPAGTQTCPAAPATITGTIKPENIIGPANQGLAAGEFGELIRAIRAGVTYVNVHSATFPAGEIRAQLGH